MGNPENGNGTDILKEAKTVQENGEQRVEEVTEEMKAQLLKEFEEKDQRERERELFRGKTLEELHEERRKKYSRYR